MRASTRKYHHHVVVAVGIGALIVGHSMTNADTTDGEGAARQLATPHASEDA